MKPPSVTPWNAFCSPRVRRSIAGLVVLALALAALYRLVMTPIRSPSRFDDFLELCLWGDEPSVMFILGEDPAYLDKFSMDGWSCLINAAKKNRTELVDALLKRNASTGTLHMKHTALRGASMFGYTAVVERLLEAGALVDAMSEHDRTPLMGAAMNGHRDIVELLIKYGADPSIRNEDGETAKDLARKNGYKRIAALIA